MPDDSRTLKRTPYVEINVSGPEHAGKTTLIALIARSLQDAGLTVQVQLADPQIFEKIAMGQEALRARLHKDTQVRLTETQTARGEPDAE